MQYHFHNDASRALFLPVYFFLDLFARARARAKVKNTAKAQMKKETTPPRPCTALDMY